MAEIAMIPYNVLETNSYDEERGRKEREKRIEYTDSDSEKFQIAKIIEIGSLKNLEDERIQEKE